MTTGDSMSTGTKGGWLRELQKSKARRITLDDAGCPNFWVLLIDPSTQPYGWLVKMGKGRRTTDLTEMPPEEIEEVFKDQKKMLIDLIVDWNITHPETGEPLPIPRESNDSIDLLPIQFITLINEQLGKLFETMGPPPPSGR